MTIYSLTLREEHRVQLAKEVLGGETECVAYILLRKVVIGLDPWRRERHIRYLVREVLPVPPAEILDASRSHVTWHTRSLAALLGRAEAACCAVGVVHSHPKGVEQFSVQDNKNEPDLIEMVQNRDGPDARLVSLVLTEDENLFGRVWEHPKRVAELKPIRTVGERLRLFYPGRGRGEEIATLQRQALTFGKALNADLRQLTVGVVGCGATGSATAMLLTRLGVGRLLLVDGDIVEDTNLNRLHGATQSDADAMAPKVSVLKRELTRYALGTKIHAVEGWIGDSRIRDALRACDIVFSCTDDHDGRLLLSRFAYFYLVPVFDMGLGIEVGGGDPPELKALDGRVTIVGPTLPCLSCLGVVDAVRAAAEAMRRTEPEHYERLRAERYVEGSGIPNPAVVTFTTEVATMAVNEFLHRLQGFRGEDGATNYRIRKFALNEDLRPLSKPEPACRICGLQVNWGLGDVEPFLGRME